MRNKEPKWSPSPLNGERAGVRGGNKPACCSAQRVSTRPLVNGISDSGDIGNSHPSPQPSPREGRGRSIPAASLLRHRSISRCLLQGLAVVCAWAFLAQPLARAGGTVDNYSSLTNFLAALNGGGTVTFNCNGTIVLTNTITITTDTVLVGRTNQVLSAGNHFRIFNVNTNVTLTLLNLTLSDGMTNIGGAIYNQGTVMASNCTFGGNAALGNNGAAGPNGSNGSSGGNGGAGGSGTAGLGAAVYNLGTSFFDDCTFNLNTAAGGDGGNGGNGGNGSSFNAGNGGNGGSGGSGFGGAIYNVGRVALNDCSFTANTAVGGAAGSGGTAGTGPLAGRNGSGGTGAPGSGAGLFNAGTATVTNCTFAENSGTGGNSATAGTQSGGAGISGATGGDSLGGGIFNAGMNVVINCTFSTNMVLAGNGGNGGPGINSNAGNGGAGGTGAGGALYNSSQTFVTNCTFVGSSARGGIGGTAGTGTFAGSNGSVGASRGANIANGAGTFNLKNSILSSPTIGTATNVTCTNNIITSTNGTSTTNVVCTTNIITSTALNSFGVTDRGYNLSSDASLSLASTNSRNNIDPKLGPLADNGGPTLTFALLTNSPAIDAGDPGFCLDTDQRGVARGFGAACDIGAYELEGSDLSGRIVRFQGTNSIPVPNVVVLVLGNDGITHSNVTQSDGRYHFTRLPTGDYDITPTATNYVFHPNDAEGTSLSVTLNGNIDDADFTAVPALSISGNCYLGHVDQPQEPLPGVTLTAENDSGDTFSGVSDTNGDYVIIGLEAGNYTVTPTLNGYIFNIPVASVTLLSGDRLHLDFGGTNTLFTLGGRISQNGVPVANVSVMVSSDAMGGRTVQTDTNGDYRVNQLPEDTYLITPMQAGYDFTPSVASIDLVTDTTNIDFQASGQYLINGQIIAGSVGLNVSGIAVNAALCCSGVADSGGNYAISDVPPGTYSVTPTQAGLTFRPRSLPVTIPPSGFGLSFTAFTAFAISGRITAYTNNGPVLVGVTVSAGGVTTTTDTNGNYVLNGVPSDADSVTAQFSNYGFESNPRSVNLTNNLANVNFLGYTLYNISGRVTDSGVGVSNILVGLADGTKVAATDANGNYKISGARAGPNTVVPSRPGYNFTPASTNVSSLSDITNINFTASGNFVITGVIMTNGGPLANVTVTAGNKVGVTGANGVYTIANLSPRTYTVTPSLTKYAFNPGSLSVTLDTNGFNNANFTAIPTFSISGKVKEGANNLAGVTFTAVSPIGPTTNTAVSDANGNYTLTNVRAGTNTVTPSLAGYEFAVTNSTATNLTLVLGSNTNIADFVGTRVYSILGRVTESGLGLSNVVVTIGGTNSVQTDTNGNYGFFGVHANTNIVLTPVLTGYTFSPATQTVAVGPSLSGVNFVASGIYTLGGHVTKSGAGVGSVVVTATWNTGNRSAATDGSGSYSIGGLPPRTYTVRPSLAGNVFSPLTTNVTVGPSINTINFAAISTFNLTGFVSDDTNGPGLAGVTISAVATTPPLTNTAVTGFLGTYTLTNIPMGANTLTPSRLGFIFSPSTQTTNVTTNSSVGDFVALHALTISGHISEGGYGIPGLLVSAPPGSAISDTNGDYTITLPVGNYIVQAATNGIGFDPTNYSVSLTGDQSGLDFTARPLRLAISQTNRPIKLTLLGVPARPYIIQTVTNLDASTPSAWLSISTNTVDSTSGLYDFIDVGSTNFPFRIYRTRTP